MSIFYMWKLCFGQAAATLWTNLPKIDVRMWKTFSASNQQFSLRFVACLAEDFNDNASALYCLLKYLGTNPLTRISLSINIAVMS